MHIELISLYVLTTSLTFYNTLPIHVLSNHYYPSLLSYSITSSFSILIPYLNYYHLLVLINILLYSDSGI